MKERFYRITEDRGYDKYPSWQKYILFTKLSHDDIDDYADMGASIIVGSRLKKACPSFNGEKCLTKEYNNLSKENINDLSEYISGFDEREME